MGICWRTFQYINICRDLLFFLHYAYYRDLQFHFWQHEHKHIKWYADRSDCNKSFKLKLFEAKSNLFLEAGLTLKCFALWAAQSDCIKPICVCTATNWLHQKVFGRRAKGKARDQTLQFPRVLQNSRASPCLLCYVSLTAFIYAICWRGSQVYLEEVWYSSFLALKGKQLQSALWGNFFLVSEFFLLSFFAYSRE